LGIDGRDEFGRFLPLNYLESFGDFKPPVYTYLTIPSVAILGLNKESVRLPAAILGISTVVLTYFLTKRLFDDKKIALLSMLFLAISPWKSLEKGVLITSVEYNSTAFEQGLRQGQIITELDGKKIDNLNDFSEIMKNKFMGESVKTIFTLKDSTEIIIFSKIAPEITVSEIPKTFKKLPTDKPKIIFVP